MIQKSTVLLWVSGSILAAACSSDTGSERSIVETLINPDAGIGQISPASGNFSGAGPLRPSLGFGQFLVDFREIYNWTGTFVALIAQKCVK